MAAPLARLLLTPTARLARSLTRELAREMVDKGRSAWLPPQILSFSAWLSQLRDDYLINSDDSRVPVDAQQSLLLWQSQIDTDVFIGEPQVAGLAQRSWRLIHEYDLESPAHWPALLLSEDSRRFKDWAAAYRATCARLGVVDEWSFASELPSLVADKQIKVPASLELIGFELPMNPLQSKILAAFEAAGTQIKRRETSGRVNVQPEILEYESPDDELTGAALWARHLLEATPDQSIAVVVTDLQGRTDRVDALFRQVFDPPGFNLRSADPELWHISLGKPLLDWPLVSDALAILQLADHRLTQPEATHFLRSPYVSGWNIEAGARNQTLARLARSAPFDLTTNELQWALQRSEANLLAEHLTSWQRVRKEAASTAWPSQWAGYFQEELSSLGFGNGRELTSREYQILQRWHDLLETFSTIDAVTQAPLSRERALRFLRERAGAVIFRERNPGVSIEVLGVEEALGSRFDAMWITTLDSDTWPGPARRDALIPAAVQAAVPRATSEGCLTQAQLELAGLLAAAPIIHGSFARGTEDAAIQVTALLSDCTVQLADPPAAPTPATMAPPQQDTQAPAFEGESARGGTGVLRNQSSCPFRAFAERRLGASDLTPPRPGLDAGQRGTVIHKALELFWSGLDGSKDLAALQPQDQEHKIQIAVAAAIDEFTSHFLLTLTSAGRRLEQRRTERVLARWLDIERQRGAFSVMEHERPITLELAGLTLTGKIDRLDRLADDSIMLIDYKTGRASKSDWFPETRIADPQLPAYAVSMDTEPGAIAFARIRPDDLKFEGLSDADAETPGVGELVNEGRKFKELESWNELMADWRIHLEALASDFQLGKAQVDPRKPADCAYCHLHALCRIQERASFDSLVQEGEDE